MPKKQQISYIKPEEPSFLKEIKKKVGYKDGPTIEDKRKYEEDNEEGDEQEREREREEKPQVVVLKEGDLSEAELQKYLKQKEDEEDKKKIETGKITFTKPQSSNKRHSSEDDNMATTKKQKKADSSASNKNSTVKASNQARLLSFANDEDDD